MTFKDIQQRLQPELDIMNAYMWEALHSPLPMLNDIVKNYMSKRGKQIRPLLVILSAKLLGEVNERVLHAGASLEILHNASLIHDDVIDRTPLRRDIPTINAVWNNHIAVLVGDYMVSKSLDETIRAGSLEISKIMSHLADILSEGELHQIFVARDHDYSLKKYLRTIEMKTAILFQSCVRMGADAAGIEPAAAEELVKFANYMGLCFQIRDDIFDYMGKGDIGKPTGNDLKENKVTLPLLYAIHTVPKEERIPMLALLEKGDLNDDEVAQLIDFAVRNGGIEYSQNIMERLRAKALRHLMTYERNDARDDLEWILEFIINRTN